MDSHRIFLVGDSLYSEILSQLLGQFQEVYIMGSATTVEGALQEVSPSPPDVFILAAPERCNPQDLTRLLEIYPDIPIICAELENNTLRVFSSQQLQARSADLISAITTLPQRR